MLTAARFSFQDLWHDRSRTLLSITGLSVIIASYFLLTALSYTFAGYLHLTLAGRNLIVLQTGLFEPSDARIEPEVISAIQELVPDTVSRYSPLIYRYTRLNEHVAPLAAAPIQDWEPVYHLQLVAGAWPVGAGDILVSEGIAETNDWQVGSVVEIFGSNLTVAGIFRVPGSAFAAVWMPEQTYWNLFDTQRGYQGVFVQAAEGVDPDALLARLQNDPRLAGGYTVYFEENYARQYNRIFKNVSSMMVIASGLALLGIVFGIFNATTLSTLERSHELGILLGMGFSHRSVRGFILARSMSLGLLAYGVGLAVAAVYTAGQQAFAPLFIFGYPMNLKLTLAMAGIGLAWIASMVFLGAWLSTRQMFKMRVVALLCE